MSSFISSESWTVAELGVKMSTQPAVIRRLLTYWVTQGILKEGPVDTFSIVESIQEAAAGGQGWIILCGWMGLVYEFACHVLC